MNITQKQFRAIAPLADAATLDSLFAPSADGQPVIDRILAECKLDEPAVMVQFLACCSLATDRFTQFHFGYLGVDVTTWLSQRKETSPYVAENGEPEQGRALSFCDFKLYEDAREWDWETVANHCASIFPIPKCTQWMDIHNRLTEICAVMGIEDQTDKYLAES